MESPTFFRSSPRLRRWRNVWKLGSSAWDGSHAGTRLISQHALDGAAFLIRHVPDNLGSVCVCPNRERERERSSVRGQGQSVSCSLCPRAPRAQRGWSRAPAATSRHVVRAAGDVRACHLRRSGITGESPSEWPPRHASSAPATGVLLPASRAAARPFSAPRLTEWSRPVRDAAGRLNWCRGYLVAETRDDTCQLLMR